jgi:membrane protein
VSQFWEILKLTAKKVTDPFYAGGAAEVAFFLILSLVPTTILLAQLLNVFTLSMGMIREMMPLYLSDDFQEIILPLLNYNPSTGFSIALILLALWAGSKSLFSLMRMSNYAYKGGNGYKNPIFGYVKERMRAIITILMVLITLIFALYILVFGEVIVRSVLYYLNDFLQEDIKFSSVWYSMRWMIALLMYFFMVLSIYYMLPNRESTIARLIVKGFWRTIRNFVVSWFTKSREIFRMIVPGSIFAAGGMLFATGLYSLYMKHIAAKNFNILYGGLSSIVILLIWFYLLSFILIIGIQLNAAYAEKINERTGGNENE